MFFKALAGAAAQARQIVGVPGENRSPLTKICFTPISAIAMARSATTAIMVTMTVFIGVCTILGTNIGKIWQFFAEIHFYFVT